MYNYNIITSEKKKVLKDVKRGKEQPWRSQKLKTLDLASSFDRLGLKKSYRVSECGTFLEFKYFNKTNDLKLNKSNFCKARLCPMCSWRRSKKIFGQVSQVMDKALEKKDYRFIFLTLTIKNIEGEELSKTIDKLFHAYNLLTKRKIVKQSIKGWFRALEVTHNMDKNSPNYDTYHPHFHIILMVNKSYFNDTKSYISQEKWTSLWKSCLKVDYTPLVDVRAFKSDTKIKTKKSIAETAKYTVKSDDYIIKNKNGEIDEELTDNSVWILDTALLNRRLTAFGGELKKIHRELNLDDTENGDLINTDNEEIRDDLEYIIMRYNWNVGLSNYTQI